MIRAGFSLLEMIIATGILAASTVVLMSMFSTAINTHARRAEERIVAQMLCQSKLDELLANPSELMPIRADILPQFPGWVYSIEVQPTSLDKFVQVRVAVTRIPGMPTGAQLEMQPADKEETFAFDSLKLLSNPTFALTRWLQFDGDVSAFTELQSFDGLETPTSPNRLNSRQVPWSNE